MSQSQLIESYYNDGYVYCLLTRITDPNSKTQLVKIGKTTMKTCDSEHQVINKLMRRYNTYYPEYDVLYFKRTGNCHKAEKQIFRNLKKLHYKREMYLYDPDKIKKAFDNACVRFPNIQDQLTKLNINQISNTNIAIRNLEVNNDQINKSNE